MSDKPKFARADALAVARVIVAFINPFCERLVVAGSLRRRKQSVGDIEILYIPKFNTVPDGLFDTKSINLVDQQLDGIIRLGTISKRLNARGSETWGEWNKLARHVSSQIPIDFFQSTEANWFSYLVCRTGSAENNILISAAAQAKGWKWHPYGSGFTDHQGNPIRAISEQNVFSLAGLPYLEPWQR